MLTSPLQVLGSMFFLCLCLSTVAWVGSCARRETVLRGLPELTGPRATGTHHGPDTRLVSPDNVHFGLVAARSHCTQELVTESADKLKQQSHVKLYLEIHKKSMLRTQCLQKTTARHVGVDRKTLFWSVCVLLEPIKRNKKRPSIHVHGVSRHVR